MGKLNATKKEIRLTVHIWYKYSHQRKEVVIQAGLQQYVVYNNHILNIKTQVI